MASKAKTEHYVPQVLLRLHANDPSAKRGTEQVWCFDKKTDKVFSPNIKGIVAGARFYEAEVEGVDVNLEEPLGKVESKSPRFSPESSRAAALRDYAARIETRSQYLRRSNS